MTVVVAADVVDAVTVVVIDIGVVAAVIRKEHTTQTKAVDSSFIQAKPSTVVFQLPVCSKSSQQQQEQ